MEQQSLPRKGRFVSEAAAWAGVVNAPRQFWREIVPCLPRASEADTEQDHVQIRPGQSGQRYTVATVTRVTSKATREAPSGTASEVTEQPEGGSWTTR